MTTTTTTERFEKSTNLNGIDWNAYSASYDLMADYNPAYQDNMQLLENLISKSDLPAEPRICDVGAGTGNYICRMAKIFPNASFVHIDINEAMSKYARKKYHSLGIDVDFRIGSFHDMVLEQQSFDLVICINALYAMPSHTLALQKIYSSISENGLFFSIDYGRKMQIASWCWFMFKEIYKNHGFTGLYKFFVSGSEAVRQNKAGQRSQVDGGYWLHSPDEFKQALTSVGFEVSAQVMCYRGAADLALCRKLE